MESTAVYVDENSKKKYEKSKMKLPEETSISETNNHEKLNKTLSNLQKATEIVKERLIVWNCCFCPRLQAIDCCNSCDVDIHSHIGI
jgi:hypothetical protein